MSMTPNRRVSTAVATVAVFLLIGLTVGVAGAISMVWAQGQFLAPGADQRTQVLGQLFVSVIHFQSTVVLFLLGPVLAAVLGLGLGSRIGSSTTAGLVSGGSALLGFYLMTVVAILLMGLALSPAGSRQTYSLGQAVGPVVVAGIAAGAAGGIAGALGSRFR